MENDRYSLDQADVTRNRARYRSREGWGRVGSTKIKVFIHFYHKAAVQFGLFTRTSLVIWFSRTVVSHDIRNGVGDPLGRVP